MCFFVEVTKILNLVDYSDCSEFKLSEIFLHITMILYNI